jgi:hypothetical protein
MLRNVPSAMLRKLVTLSQRKETLLARVQEIDQEMLRIQSRFESGNIRTVASTKVTITRPSSKKRRQVARGELKAKIMAALRAAGKGGATIGDLSKKLRVKRANLYVWFNGTGRNERNVRKIGPATYRLLR